MCIFAIIIEKCKIYEKNNYEPNRCSPKERQKTGEKEKSILEKRINPLCEPLAGVLFRQPKCINNIPGKQLFVMHLFSIESEDHIDPQICDFV